ncbi:hypothetical protein [Streptomyces virginiae]|uniref:hypothetical protein n=1 Tax=Streptomyces virginiae TaxID=1961 RepID=UPI0034453842
MARHGRAGRQGQALLPHAEAVLERLRQAELEVRYRGGGNWDQAAQRRAVQDLAALLGEWS